MNDAVLDRWFAGEGAGLIAKDFGHTRSWVFKIVTKARKAGDPRAISHADFSAGEDGWRRRYTLRHEGGRIAGWAFA